jgi:hypothetical protein
MKRDVVIDALRGLMLVIMTVDHFGGAPTLITNESLGFVSAAGGFVFLSGLLAGSVYGRAAGGGMYSLRKRVYHRTQVIYLVHLLIVLLYLFQVFALPTSPAMAKYQYLRTNPLQAVPLAFCLLYQPASLGILPIYIMSMLVLPYVLMQYEKGRQNMVLMVSGIVWAVAQFGGQELFQGFLRQYVPIDLGNFDILAWQFLFFSGSWIGYTILLKRSHQIKYNPFLLGSAFVLLLGLYLLRHFDVGKSELSALLNLDVATSKKHLGWLRLIDLAVVTYLVNWLTGTYKEAFKGLKWLITLGQNSLAVFWYHFFAIGMLLWVEPRMGLHWGKLHSVLAICLVLSLTIPAMARGKFISLRRRQLNPMGGSLPA